MGVIKRNIPNFITCLNLLCGCIGIACLLDNRHLIAVYLMLVALVFDFLDGLLARLLQVTSPIGRDLDSLADVVTFGLLPALMMYRLLYWTLFHYYYGPPRWGMNFDDMPLLNLKYIALLIPVFSAIRLARFNNDNSQSHNFKGLATPANGLLLASIFYLTLIKSKMAKPEYIWGVPPSHSAGMAAQNLLEEKLVWMFSDPRILIGFILLSCFLLVSPIKLMAFKFKGFSWKENKWKYILLIVCLPLAIWLGFASAPIILILYILISQIHFRTKRHEIQS